jgi:hypothetical protein
MEIRRGTILRMRAKFCRRWDNPARQARRRWRVSWVRTDDRGVERVGIQLVGGPFVRHAGGFLGYVRPWIEERMCLVRPEASKEKKRRQSPTPTK